MANKTLSTLRNDEQNTFNAYSRAMSVYLETHTDHIETPAHMFEASLAELASFHPLFALAEMRRQRMEKLWAAWQAARRAAREQTIFSFAEPAVA